mgnify:CR=1 FL=1
MYTFAPHFSEERYWMDFLKDYIISFKGLAPGKHDFKMIADDRFFEAMENELVRLGSFSVHVELVKEERMLSLHFRIEGSVHVECDRCLEDLELRISTQDRLFVKFGDSHREVSDEIVVIPETAHQIDVSRYVNDYITLAIPLRKVHSDNGDLKDRCDPRVIEKLRELSAQSSSDPRWNKLKDLKNN